MPGSPVCSLLYVLLLLCSCTGVIEYPKKQHEEEKERRRVSEGTAGQAGKERCGCRSMRPLAVGEPRYYVSSALRQPTVNKWDLMKLKASVWPKTPSFRQSGRL